MSYTGMLKENEPSGYGTLEFEEGGSFYGEFSCGTVDGSGVYVFRASRGEIDDPIYGNDWSIVYDQDCDLPACKRYSGLTLHGIFQGYGLGITPKGEHYVGEVQDYYRSGYGRIYKSNNELRTEGMFAPGE